LDRRIGDAADMAMIELVDFNEIYNVKTVVGEEKKKTRRGRAKKVAETTAPAAETAPEVAPEAPTTEATEETTPTAE
jgi:large subunit ribosomal protein L17